MKNFKYVLTTLLIVFLISSCKKENVELHKITYEIEFFPTTIMPANSFNVLTLPSNENFDLRVVDKSKLQTVNYWGLKKGDKVEFNISAKQNYWFEMRILIDDVLVSSREVKISDVNYMQVEWFKQTGINDYKGGWSLIEFTFN